MSNDTDLHLQFRRVILLLSDKVDVAFYEHAGDGRTEGEEIAAFQEAVREANFKSLNSAHIALRDYVAIVNRQLTNEAITTIGVVLRAIDDATEGNALTSSETVYHTAINIRDIAYQEAKTAVNDDIYVGLAQKTHMFARSASQFARIALHEVSELQYIKELRKVEHIFVGDIVPVLTYAQDVYTNAYSLLRDATNIMNEKNKAAEKIVYKRIKAAEIQKSLERFLSVMNELQNALRNATNAEVQVRVKLSRGDDTDDASQKFTIMLHTLETVAQKAHDTLRTWLIDRQTNQSEIYDIVDAHTVSVLQSIREMLDTIPIIRQLSNSSVHEVMGRFAIMFPSNTETAVMVSAFEEMCNTNRATVEMSQKVVGLATNHFKDVLVYICTLIDNALSGLNVAQLPLYHVLNAYKSILLALMEVHVVAQAVQNAVHALSESNQITTYPSYPFTASPERIIRDYSLYSMGIRQDARDLLTKHHDVLNTSSVILSEYATQLRRR